MIITHMGNGIVKFDNALDIDNENLRNFISSVETTDKNEIVKDGDDYRTWYYLEAEEIFVALQISEVSIEHLQRERVENEVNFDFNFEF